MIQGFRANDPISLLACETNTSIITKNDNLTITCGCCKVIFLVVSGPCFWSLHFFLHTFRCSAILEPSCYLNLTIFMNIKTLFKAFSVSNIISIFFHNTSTLVSSSKLLYELMSTKHCIYVAINFKCMISKVDASTFSCFVRPRCTDNHKCLHNKKSLTLDFHIEQFGPVNLSIPPKGSSIF